MKDRQQKQGGNRPNKRDQDPSRHGDPQRRDDRSGTETGRPREGGIQDPQRRGGPDDRRGMRGDDIDQPSEPRRPFDETNVENDDDDLRR